MIQKTYLKVIERDAENWFGFQLAFSADGTTLAAGDPLERGGATGINGDETDLGAVSAATGVNGDQCNNDALKSGAVYM